jgi:hypothetical protein
VGVHCHGCHADAWGIGPDFAPAKRLKLSRNPEDGVGAASRCVLVNVCTSSLPQSDFYLLHHAGSTVCDDARRLIAMKKVGANPRDALYEPRHDRNILTRDVRRK